MPTEDAVPSIDDFRAADGSSEAIRAAFYRLDDARAANAREIERLAEARPALLLSATAAEIDRADRTARRRRILGEQLDLLEQQLRADFKVAKEAEQDREYAAALAEAETLAAAWTAEIASKYPKLANQLAELMQRGRVVEERFAAVNEMPGRTRHYETTGAALPRAYSDQTNGGAGLPDLVALPSLTPGPAIWPPRSNALQLAPRRSARPFQSHAARVA